MNPRFFSFVSTLVLLTAPVAARADGYRVVWDDFQSGFVADTPGAPWLHFSAGAFVADDGIVTTSGQGLSVVASGTNPITHAPAFTSTMGHETGWLTAFDRIKWLAIMNHTSSKGFLGFDAEPGKELACEATISGQVLGAWGHPFGVAAPFPSSDPRLGTVAMSAFDPETFVIFNFLLTNDLIYAMYERAPFLRDTQGDYAAFTYAVPVAFRCPHERHRLKIAYDKARGRVRWIVDDREVLRVSNIGARAGRAYMIIDRGGENVTVSPDQIDCGMGTFTFLDAYGPTGRALVQLDPDGGSYFDPRFGEPFQATFLDDDSLTSNRLFGQGAAMQVARYVVSSRRAP